MRAYHEVLNRICEEVQQNMANKVKGTSDEMDWDVSMEILLFYAMVGHKPVGVNRHFMMLSIHDRFSGYINKQMHSKKIWDHLDSMYDMAALHESEIIPFPNDETEFELSSDFDDMVLNKFGVSLTHTEMDESAQLKMNTALKSSRKMNAAKLKPSLSPMINKSKELLSAKPSNPSTPISHKGKSTPSSKIEEKSIFTESTGIKNKLDVLTPAKITKSKRSSSPFSVKSSKSETAHSREDSPDIPLIKKPKPERSSSPATIKKAALKLEASSTPISVKKVAKEQSNSSSKHGRSDSTDSPIRKIKSDRDSMKKKGKESSETPGSKKSGKLDINGIRKPKLDSDSSAKKAGESSSRKQLKVDCKSIQNEKTKGLKLDETDSFSGSRKSSPMVRIESVDSIKKRKRQKSDESPKKSTPTVKRRRT